MGKNFAVTVCTKKSYRTKNGIIIGLIALLSFFAVAMAVYSLIKGNILFAISYVLAIILGFTYVFIRVNTVFATYIATDRKTLYMKNWANDFLPYAANSKLKVIREFIPDKTKIVEIPVEEISKILIGTKNFIKRTCGANSEFAHKVRPYESSRDYYKKRMLQSMDMVYVETYSQECYYMPVVNFDRHNLVKLVQLLERKNTGIEVKTSSREFRNLRTKE